MNRSFAVVLTGLLFIGAAAASSFEEARAGFEARDPQALAMLESVVADAPEDAQALLLLGRAQLRARRVEAGVSTLEKAVKLAPGDAEVRYRLGQAYGARIEEVGLLSKMAMAGRLRGSLEKAIELDPGHLDARSGLMQFYAMAPGLAGGGREKARAQAAEIARRNPARGHLAQAFLHEQDKEPAAALKEYEAAVAADPDYLVGRLSLGLAYQRAERWDAAFAVYDALVADQPDSAAAWYQLGRTAALSGQRLDDGLAAMRRFLALPPEENTPSPSGAWYRIGDLHAHAGRKDEARRAYEQALKLDPKDAEVKAALAKLG